MYTALLTVIANELIVRQWFSNMKQLDLEIVTTFDGNLTTSLPEDMFNAIHMQISVAQEKLPREHFKDAVVSVYQ